MSEGNKFDFSSLKLQPHRTPSTSNDKPASQFNFNLSQLTNDKPTTTSSATTLTSASTPSTGPAKSSAPPQFSFNPTFSGGPSSSSSISSGFPSASSSINNSNSPARKNDFKFDFNSIGKNSNTLSTTPNAANSSTTTIASTGISFLGPNISTAPSTSYNLGIYSTKLTFNFGTGQDFQADKREFSESTFSFMNSFNFGSSNLSQTISGLSQPLISGGSSQKDDDVANDDATEDAKLIEAEKTGEEDEEKLLECKAMLYMYVKDAEGKGTYAERGGGEFHFNYNPKEKFYRMILRRQNLGKVVLNQRVFAKMGPKLANAKTLRFLGKIFKEKEIKEKKEGEKDEEKKGEEENEEDASKLDVLVLKVGDAEVMKELDKLLTKAVSECK